MGHKGFSGSSLSACSWYEPSLFLLNAMHLPGMMSSLKVLDLCGNRVSDKGACALAAMLISEGAQSSLPLQVLELEGNMVSAGRHTCNHM